MRTLSISYFKTIDTSMEPTPRVSVVISTYNREDKLRRAINSVLGQTYQDFEVVVVDDHSPVKLNWVDQPKVRYIYLDSNFGNDTRPKNVGTKESRGEYIAYLDDDNEFRPDHLNVLVNALDKDPEVDVVYGDRWVVDEENKIPARMGVSEDFNTSSLITHNYIDTGDVLIRKSAIEYVGGWDERYRKYVDWNLFLRMAKAGLKFKHIPIIISNYYLHPNMKSVTVKDRQPDGSPSVPLGSAPVHRPEWDAYDLEIHLPYLGKTFKPRVAVFSLTYDRLEYTKQAFDSLFATADYPFDLFVVDNGSSDKTPKYLRGLADKKKAKQIILNPDNKGISIASNQAIGLINGHYDIVVKFDNDCMCLTKGWLAKMIDIWNSNHMIALSCYVQGLKDNPGGAPRMAYGTIRGELVGMTKHLGGICHFVDSRAYKTFRWPENEQLHGVQDLEFSQHLLFSGYQMGYLESFYVNHGPLGTEAQKKDFPSYFERRKQEKVKRYE